MTRILIVEDHTLVREAVAQTLLHLEEGVECVEACCADDALAALEKGGDWDLAVIDLMLPDMNGFSLLAVLAKRFPDVPTVVVSALDDAPTVQRAMKGGRRRGAVPVQERFGLTAAQTRVMELLSQGKTNREIAELLGLSEGTVKVHMSAIFRALNVSSRAQALVVIARHGNRL